MVYVLFVADFFSINLVGLAVGAYFSALQEFTRVCRGRTLIIVTPSGVFEGAELVGLCALFFLIFCFLLYQAVREWHAGRVSRLMRKRERLARVGASKRAMRALQVLDEGCFDALEEMLPQCGSLKAAVGLSRAARLALRCPSNTPANKIIVLDWLNRNAPEHMSYTQRSRIFPLACVMTFVKDQRELDADEVAKLLGVCSEAY